MIWHFICFLMLFSHISLVFCYIRKTYVDQSPKPQVGSNQLKASTLPIPFGEILGSHCVTWHNFAKPYFMHHWTSHWGLGRKAHTPMAKQGKIFRLDLSISGSFQQLWFSWQKSPPSHNPHPSGQTGENFCTGSIHFMQFPATLVQLAEKPPPHFFFFLFWETQLASHRWITHGLHNTNPHSDSSYPNIFFRSPTLSTFQNTHI